MFVFIMTCILVTIFYFHIAGITLALFGGVQKHSTDQNKVPVRGDIHVIVVGRKYLFVSHHFFDSLLFYSHIEILLCFVIFP